jgi:putative sigma-54 modulation protein
MEIQVRALRIEVTNALRAHGERCLRFALGRFGDRIDRVTVWLADLNGPRGGIDKGCRIGVRLRPMGSVLVLEAADDPYAALGRAAGRAGRAVARRLARDQGRRLGFREPRTRGGWSPQLQPGNEG